MFFRGDIFWHSLSFLIFSLSLPYIWSSDFPLHNTLAMLHTKSSCPSLGPPFTPRDPSPLPFLLSLKSVFDIPSHHPISRRHVLRPAYHGYGGR